MNNLKSLILDIAAVTEQAAISCFPFIGRGDEKAADQAAVNSMRNNLNNLAISGQIVIGEGERDEAPMLYIGEKVGSGGTNLDIALDPLEGTTLCAHASNNSLAVIAIGPQDSILHAPDLYMDKLAVGNCHIPEGLLNLDNSIKENLSIIANYKQKSLNELNVMVLKRERHEQLIAEIRNLGVKITLISDGDIAAAIYTTDPKTGIDVYIGSGGAPEGVLAAAALKTIGGQFIGRLLFKNQEQITRAALMGITDINKQYNINDLIKDDIIFAATGVTNGNLLAGVIADENYYYTETIALHYKTSTIRKIQSRIRK